jgi:hypothetical protein
MFSLERGAHGRASVRSPQGDGIPMLLFRWKVRVRKIQCSSARMAREGTFPACARIRVSAFWIFSLLCPYSIETWKNPVGCPFEREARSEKCSRDFSPCSVRCGALQPYRVRDPEQSEPEHRVLLPLSVAILVPQRNQWNKRHIQRMGETCGHIKPGGANVLVSRSS